MPVPPYRRQKIFDQVLFAIDHAFHRSVVLMGPRRVGKTTLLRQLVNELIESGRYKRKNVVYLSLEHPLFQTKALDDLYFLLRKHKLEEGPACFIFDEVQYLYEWPRYLKWLHDTFPTEQFIVSGSAAAVLKMASRESGVGRFRDIQMGPITFAEQLELQDDTAWLTAKLTDLSKQDFQKLNEKFQGYIDWGGLPELLDNQSLPVVPEYYTAIDVVEKVMNKDLPSLFGLENTTEVNRLLTYLTIHTGQETNLQTLSEHSNGISKETLKKYLKYLEAAFLIHIVYRVDENARRFMRENRFKVYVSIPALHSALFSTKRPTDPTYGHLVETALCIQRPNSQFIPDYYYGRWEKGEVDFVYTEVTGTVVGAMEVKWSDTATAPNLYYFAKRTGLKLVVETTQTEVGEVQKEDLTILRRPAAWMALKLPQMPKVKLPSDWTEWVQQG